MDVRGKIHFTIMKQSIVSICFPSFYLCNLDTYAILLKRAETVIVGIPSQNCVLGCLLISVLRCFMHHYKLTRIAGCSAMACCMQVGLLVASAS